jgi:EmrB/QacA subfamily drug resistance transporter
MTIGTKEVGTAGEVRSGRWLALAALVLSGLVVGFDTTILITALPTLSTKLGATTSQLQWMSDAYTLALAGLLLPAGLLGDRFGRRLVLLVGVAIFGVATVVASTLTSADGLIWMRAFMGVGSAAILPLSISILPTMFSKRERPRAVAVATASMMLGLPLGPLVAGWLLTHFEWNSIFLINVPVVALALLGIALWVPESRQPGAPRMDWPGAVLSVVGITGLVYGIIEEPASGWSSGRVVAGIAGGLLVLAAFVAWELRVREPLVDLRLFLNGRFTWATVAFTVVGFTMTGVMFVISPYLQVVLGNDAQGTGIRLLPMIGMLLVGASATGQLVPRVGARYLVAGGLLVSCAGMLILSRVTADGGYGPVALGISVLGLGIGIAMPAALDAILSALPEDRLGVGNGLYRTLQQIGASFGVAILGSILATAYRDAMTPHVAGLPAQARDAILGSVAGASVVAQHLPPRLAGPLVGAADQAYTAGMGDVLLVTAVLGAAGAILIGLFLPGRATGADRGEEPAAEPRVA